MNKLFLGNNQYILHIFTDKEIERRKRIYKIQQNINNFYKYILVDYENNSIVCETNSRYILKTKLTLLDAKFFSCFRSCKFDSWGLISEATITFTK